MIKTFLSESQISATYSRTDLPLRVSACPGSGKTTTLLERVKHIIKTSPIFNGSELRFVLGLVFSKNASDELQARLSKDSTLLSAYCNARKPRNILITTFHSICLSIVKTHFLKLGFTARPNIISSFKAIKLLKEYFRSSTPSNVEPIHNLDFVNRLFKSFQFAKATGDPIKALSRSSDCQAIIDIYNKYEALMMKNNVVDYHGIILYSTSLLRQDKTILSHYQFLYPFVLVDEFQDINRSQFDLICVLGNHGRVSVVGDVNQLIYGFQGASRDIFASFDRSFQPTAGPGAIHSSSSINNCTVVQLGVNYRSRGPIVAACNGLVEADTDSRPAAHGSSTYLRMVSTPENSQGPAVSLRECDHEQDEADFIASQIHALITGAMPTTSFSSHSPGEGMGMERPLMFQDIAILYRCHSSGFSLRRLLPSSIPICTHGRSSNEDSLVRFGATARLVVDLDNDDACLSAIPDNKSSAFATVLSVAQDAVARARGQGRRMSLLDAIERVSRGVTCLVPDKDTGRQVSRSVSCKSLLKWCGYIREQGSNYCLMVRAGGTLAAVTDKVRDLICAITSVSMGGDGLPHQTCIWGVDEGRSTAKNTRLRFVVDRMRSAYDEWIADSSLDTHSCGDSLMTFLSHILELDADTFCTGPVSAAHPRESPAVKNGIWMGTVHQAKGLQWKAVFIIQVNDGAFPLFGDAQSPNNFCSSDFTPSYDDAPNGHITEERNILYVAMSRAETYLRISYLAERPNQSGVSRFLKPLISKRLVELSRNCNSHPSTTKTPSGAPSSNQEFGFAVRPSIKAIVHVRSTSASSALVTGTGLIGHNGSRPGNGTGTIVPEPEIVPASQPLTGSTASYLPFSLARPGLTRTLTRSERDSVRPFPLPLSQRESLVCPPSHMAAASTNDSGRSECLFAQQIRFVPESTLPQTVGKKRTAPDPHAPTPGKALRENIDDRIRVLTMNTGVSLADPARSLNNQYDAVSATHCSAQDVAGRDTVKRYRDSSSPAYARSPPYLPKLKPHIGEDEVIRSGAVSAGCGQPTRSMQYRPSPEGYAPSLTRSTLPPDRSMIGARGLGSALPPGFVMASAIAKRQRSLG